MSSPIKSMPSAETTPDLELYKPFIAHVSEDDCQKEKSTDPYPKPQIIFSPGKTDGRQFLLFLRRTIEAKTRTRNILTNHNVVDCIVSCIDAMECSTFLECIARLGGQQIILVRPSC